MKVAIMQPYFFPYGGYFRLFESCDLFVIYDCVQFPRRGWVHRNKIEIGNQSQWLTLPIEKCPQNTNISELRFRRDITVWSRNYHRIIDSFESSSSLNTWPHLNVDANGCVVDYLEKTLRWSCEQLELPFHTIRSSSLSIAPHITGQERILKICERVEANYYINLSGGKSMYDKQTFDQRGIALHFLEPYEGNFTSILTRILTEPSSNIRDEIIQNL